MSYHADDPFPLEEVVVPSWLTTEPGEVDLVVASGHPDAPDYTQVRVAFKLPPQAGARP